MNWRRWLTPGVLLAIWWLFFIANRGAYRGFFSSDDLDNLAWTRLPYLLPGFAEGLFSPRFYPSNFRPVGHFYFWALGRLAGWDFAPYVAVLHAAHCLNVVLLWLLLRRLRFQWPAALLGTLAFAFHMAVFDAYWKPMYIFDVLCATFCLLSILAWISQRTLLSLGLFWLAYKSKELAVALPAVLFLYEYWLGGKRYKQLAGHVLVALSFTVQAVLTQTGQAGDYGLKLTPATLWHTLDFYASQLLLAPHLGFALLLLFIPSNNKLRFGLAAAWLFLGPMLLVPGRLYGAYLYLPLAGLAIAFAALSQGNNWRITAALLALWLPLNYARVRDLRRSALAEADESRAYVYSLLDLAKASREIDTFVIETYPAPMRRWGIEGALRLAFNKDDSHIIYLSTEKLAFPSAETKLALLSWDPALRQLHTLRRLDQKVDSAWIAMGQLTPLWQLGDGWYPRETTFRWTMPRATARLRRPEGAKEFAVVCNIGPEYIADLRRVTLSLKINGQELGTHTFTSAGWQEAAFDISKLPPQPSNDVEFTIDPVFRPRNGDPRQLGIPIGSFGFR